MNRPEYAIQIGKVQASVWKNESRTGPFYSTSIAKAWEDNGVWKTSSNFNTADIAALIPVAHACLKWIIEHPIDRTATREPSGDTPFHAD